MRRTKLLTAVIFTFQFHFACQTAVEQRVFETGLTGTVLRGPNCPVLSDKDTCPDEPFSGFFHVLDEQGNEVATFQSDETGAFRVELAPGNYLVIADESAQLLPSNQALPVSVLEAQVTEVTLRFDTGIR